jgi:glutathione S-transferase
MFFEQYSHEPYVATPRYIIRHLGRAHPRIKELPERLERGRQALGVMENHLRARRFFVSERVTIADIALYAYTHIAHEGDHDLRPYPAVRAWLDRVAQQPGHIPLTRL